MAKLNRNSLKKQVLDNGFIIIDKDGEYKFVVAQINNEIFNDMSSKLITQLKDEGKYNSWIGFIEYKNQVSYSTQMLPIYGNSKNYVTKWFTNTPEEAIDQCLRDRQMGLLKRANDYKENNN